MSSINASHPASPFSRARSPYNLCTNNSLFCIYVVHRMQYKSLKATQCRLRVCSFPGGPSRPSLSQSTHTLAHPALPEDRLGDFEHAVCNCQGTIQPLRLTVSVVAAAQVPSR